MSCVLVTGASGFLGRAITRQLIEAGHQVIGAVRDPASETRASGVKQARYIAADFCRDLDPAAWLPRLKGVDCVINAAGIIRETRMQTFAAIHALGPQALFAACLRSGVRRVVQVSALGADERASSAFHISKQRADDFLLRLPLSAAVAQPSLVYGAEGASARMFRHLASMPVIPLPGRGDQRIQPVHVHDVSLAIVALVNSQFAGRVALVGPQPVVLRDYLAQLRAGMGLDVPHFVSVPTAVLSGLSALGGWRWGIPDKAMLGMLERGNTADPAPVAALLGRNPRPVDRFIAPHAAAPVRLAARLSWLGTLLRISIALVWIISGVVSFGLYPVRESYALLARAGIPEAWAGAVLYAGAGLDLMLGMATLLVSQRRWLWVLQAATILAYTGIITFTLPEFWLHPFGPVLKNLPLLIAIWILYELDRR
jgi:nucleoside-diphosphate-sugar epimerase